MTVGEVEPGLTDEQRHALVEWLKSDDWWLVATGQTVGGEADYVRKATDHRCHCCKQIPGLCVCWTGMLTDWNTGETTSYRCSPEQHGHEDQEGESDGT